MDFPQFTDGIDLRYFIEGYTGPSHPQYLLERFPDEVYSKSPDSHFVRFMYSLMGPTGVGWLRLSLLLQRLNIEAAGYSTSDLEAAYGNPFSLARNVEESYADVDLAGLLPLDVWARIEAQDEAYRTRAIWYLNATRLGTTPDGMALAASSGTGQNCEVVENYQYFFDQHSDSPLGLSYYGTTDSLNEFIVIPRAPVSRSEQQLIHFAGASVPLGSNSFTLEYNGYSVTFAATATAGDVQGHPANPSVPIAATGLQTIPALLGNVVVTGGPAPADFTVTFTNQLSNRPVFQIKATFVSGSTIDIPVLVTTGGLDPSRESVYIGDQDKHAMQVALDYLRPVNSVPSFHPDFSTLRFQPWAQVSASSEFPQVVRFITGSSGVAWTNQDTSHWIVPAVEKEAPQPKANNQAHYQGFHNITAITAYTDTALNDSGYAAGTANLLQYNSVHLGTFPEMRPVMPYFDQFTDQSYIWTADQALTDYPEMLTVSNQGVDGSAFINNIYPADYITLQGVPDIKYHNNHFWSSMPRQSGADILEIDLGTAQAVNYLSMEVTGKPVSIQIDYELLDQAPARTFIPVRLLDGPEDSSNLFFEGIQSPWQHMEYWFDDGQEMIFTRFIRITVTRRNDTAPNRFLYNSTTRTQTAWSVEVRNLRLGRNVAPSVF